MDVGFFLLDDSDDFDSDLEIEINNSLSKVNTIPSDKNTFLQETTLYPQRDYSKLTNSGKNISSKKRESLENKRNCDGHLLIGCENVAMDTNSNLVTAAADDSLATEDVYNRNYEKANGSINGSHAVILEEDEEGPTTAETMKPLDNKIIESEIIMTQNGLDNDLPSTKEELEDSIKECLVMESDTINELEKEVDEKEIIEEGIIEEVVEKIEVEVHPEEPPLLEIEPNMVNDIIDPDMRSEEEICGSSSISSSHQKEEEEGDNMAPTLHDGVTVTTDTHPEDVAKAATTPTSDEVKLEPIPELHATKDEPILPPERPTSDYYHTGTLEYHRPSPSRQVQRSATFPRSSRERDIPGKDAQIVASIVYGTFRPRAAKRKHIKALFPPPYQNLSPSRNNTPEKTIDTIEKVQEPGVEASPHVTSQPSVVTTPDVINHAEPDKDDIINNDPESPAEKKKKANFFVQLYNNVRKSFRSKNKKKERKRH